MCITIIKKLKFMDMDMKDFATDISILGTTGQLM